MFRFLIDDYEFHLVNSFKGWMYKEEYVILQNQNLQIKIRRDMKIISLEISPLSNIKINHSLWTIKHYLEKEKTWEQPSVEELSRF